MADPIAWGLEIINGQKTDKVQDTLDGLDFETPLENGLNEIQETINNAPVGGPLPFCMRTFNAESVESGIKLTYQAHSAATVSDSDIIGSFPGQIVPYGVMIRYGTDDYPRTPTEGTLAVDDTDIITTLSNTDQPKEKTFTVVGLTSGTTYYFSVFPYSYARMYNVNGGFRTDPDRHRVSCQWTGTKGTLNVAVSVDHPVFPIGEITVTLTPTAGGSALIQTRTGVGQVTFSNLEGGEYTLTLSSVSGYSSESKTVTVIAGQLVEETIQYIVKKGLSNYSWSEISTLSASEYASQIFSLGDTKNETINGVSTQVQIIGFNHDDLADGSGKAGITFCTTNLVDYRKVDDDGFKKPFVNTEIFSWLNNTVYSGLDSQLKGVIKAVNKKTTQYHGSSTIRTDSMKLFLLSEVEVSGKHVDTASGEGTQYPWFNSNSRRTKKYNSSNQPWWLRSPCYIENHPNYGYWTWVTNNGETGNIVIGGADNFRPDWGAGVCVAFCV